MQEEISKHRGNGQVRICPSSVVSEQRSDADGVQGVAHHTTCDISVSAQGTTKGTDHYAIKKKGNPITLLL